MGFFGNIWNAVKKNVGDMKGSVFKTIGDKSGFI